MTPVFQRIFLNYLQFLPIDVLQIVLPPVVVLLLPIVVDPYPMKFIFLKQFALSRWTNFNFFNVFSMLLEILQAALVLGLFTVRIHFHQQELIFF